jgi:hypothetical protein
MLDQAEEQVFGSDIPTPIPEGEEDVELAGDGPSDEEGSDKEESSEEESDEEGGEERGDEEENEEEEDEREADEEEGGEEEAEASTDGAGRLGSPNPLRQWSDDDASPVVLLVRRPASPVVAQRPTGSQPAASPIHAAGAESRMKSNADGPMHHRRRRWLRGGASIPRHLRAWCPKPSGIGRRCRKLQRTYFNLVIICLFFKICRVFNLGCLATALRSNS